MVQYMCLFWVGYHLQPILIALVAAGALFFYYEFGKCIANLPEGVIMIIEVNS